MNHLELKIYNLIQNKEKINKLINKYLQIRNSIIVYKKPINEKLSNR